MGNLSNDGHHATASGKDLSTNSTINHIYLLTDFSQNPFNRCMEQIGNVVGDFKGSLRVDTRGWSSGLYVFVFNFDKVKIVKKLFKI